MLAALLLVGIAAASATATASASTSSSTATATFVASAPSSARSAARLFVGAGSAGLAAHGDDRAGENEHDTNGERMNVLSVDPSPSQPNAIANAINNCAPCIRC